MWKSKQAPNKVKEFNLEILEEFGEFWLKRQNFNAMQFKN